MGQGCEDFSKWLFADTASANSHILSKSESRWKQNSKLKKKRRSFENRAFGTSRPKNKRHVIICIWKLKQLPWWPIFERFCVRLRSHVALDTCAITCVMIRKRKFNCVWKIYSHNGRIQLRENENIHEYENWRKFRVCIVKRRRYLFYFRMFNTKDFVNIVFARRFDSWSLDRRKKIVRFCCEFITLRRLSVIMRFLFADESLWKFVVSEKNLAQSKRVF